MKPYLLQALYRRIDSPAVRLAAIRSARALRVRHLLVRVDTNDICNLRCPMCSMSDPDRVPVAKPMSREQFESIAASVFPKTRFLYLSCGTEPLATPHFDELLDVTGSHRVPFTSYCTNGMLLRDRFIDATLRNKISEVILSVDGASAEVFERIRVGAKWSVLEERLGALTKKIADARGPVPEIRFNFTVQRENLHELEAFASWAFQWRPATLQLRIFRPQPNALKQDDDLRTVEEFRARLPAVRRLCAARGVEVQTSEVPDAGLPANVQEALAAASAKGVGAAGSGSAAQLAPELALQLAPQLALQTQPPKVNCQLPWFTLYIKADGAVYPCGVHGSVGNLFESSYAAIERGPAMTELRRTLLRRPKSICVECQRTGKSGIG